MQPSSELQPQHGDGCGYRNGDLVRMRDKQVQCWHTKWVMICMTESLGNKDDLAVV